MDPRGLFEKLRDSLGRIAREDDPERMTAALLRRLVDDFGDDLGIDGGRVYVEEDDAWVLRSEYPDSGARRGYRIPIDYRPMRELIRHGYVLHRRDDPGLDGRIEAELGVETFAAILVGEAPRRVLSLSLRERSQHDPTVHMLNTVRYVINLTTRGRHYRDRVEQVRQIQQSLLPRDAPAFPGYDIAGRTQPAEEVGGDLYDFFPVSERSYAVAIADAAGHGLPAALQARDAIIGLRMGTEENLRITSTMEKLNRVIARSALASRFISMFYCEVEPNGNLVYCNAGHNPPLLLRKGKIRELRTGGMVLGPHPEARYERGYMHLTGHCVLLMYTDGIVEATDADGAEFGADRLRHILTERTWEAAHPLVDRVFEAVAAFSPRETPVDDQTVVAIVRPAPD